MGIRFEISSRFQIVNGPEISSRFQMEIRFEISSRFQMGIQFEISSRFQMGIQFEISSRFQIRIRCENSTRLPVCVAQWVEHSHDTQEIRVRILLLSFGKLCEKNYLPACLCGSVGRTFTRHAGDPGSNLASFYWQMM